MSVYKFSPWIYYSLCQVFMNGIALFCSVEMGSNDSECVARWRDWGISIIFACKRSFWKYCLRHTAHLLDIGYSTWAVYFSCWNSLFIDHKNYQFFDIDQQARYRFHSINNFIFISFWCFRKWNATQLACPVQFGAVRLAFKRCILDRCLMFFFCVFFLI